MNIFLIPSWYPTEDSPITGIFIKEHALALAESLPQVNIGISLWGSHKKHLLLEINDWYKIPSKLLLAGKEKSETVNLSANCTEFYTPAYTWTRKALSGNMAGIVRANENNLKQFVEINGPPHVIHAYVAHPGGYIAMQLSKKYNIPYVITEEMSPFPLPAYGKPGALSHWVRLPYFKAAANIAVSHSLFRKMQREDIPNLSIVPNFIDEDFFVPTEPERPQVRSFLFVGRLEGQKGVDILLRAVGQVIGRGFPGISLTIGGDGSEAGNLKALAKSLGIADKVKWLGRLSRVEVRDLMDQSDAFVLPSRHESFGIVVAEALAMGKPVISTNCGGPEEIVTQECGIIVEPADTDQLAGAMRQFVDGSYVFDADVIRKICIDRFSKKVVTGQIMQLYNKVVSCRPGRIS